MTGPVEIRTISPVAGEQLSLFMISHIHALELQTRRVSELALEATSETLSDSERYLLDIEVQLRLDAMDAWAQKAMFAERYPLRDGLGDVDVSSHVGGAGATGALVASLGFSRSLTVESLGLEACSVDSAHGALGTADVVDQVLWLLAQQAGSWSATLRASRAASSETGGLGYNSDECNWSLATGVLLMDSEVCALIERIAPLREDAHLLAQTMRGLAIEVASGTVSAVRAEMLNAQYVAYQEELAAVLSHPDGAWMGADALRGGLSGATVLSVGDQGVPTWRSLWTLETLDLDRIMASHPTYDISSVEAAIAAADAMDTFLVDSERAEVELDTMTSLLCMPPVAGGPGVEVGARRR